ncbi:MAG: hypothetical protein AAGG56_08665 [Pseudomonadota bacterium]
MTIKGVQKILREKGVRHVVQLGTEAQQNAASKGVSESTEMAPQLPLRFPESKSSSSPALRAETEDLSGKELAGFAEPDAPDFPPQTGYTNGAGKHSGTSPGTNACKDLPKSSPGSPANTEAAAATASSESPAVDADAAARTKALRALVVKFQELRDRMAEEDAG